MSQQITVKQWRDLGLSSTQATALKTRLDEGSAEAPEKVWRELTETFLKPDMPFAVHKFLFRWLRSRRVSDQRPFPAWSPTPAVLEHAHITAIQRELQLGSYEALHRWSIENRTSFWAMMIERLSLRFRRPYRQVASFSKGIETPEWLPGAQLNIGESCFRANGERPALVFRERPGDPVRTMNYRELDGLSNRVANGIKARGFRPGDALAVDMAMTPEAVAIYLGIIKAGCAVISIADSFTPPEISVRLRIGKARGIFTSAYVERGGKRLPMYEKVVAAQAPMAIVLSTADETIELRSGDLSWRAFLSENPSFEAVARDPHDTINILFSSGTTGDPKAIPWSHVTPIKCGVDGYFHHDIHEDDVVAWPTNLGWMMGPWLIFAALLNKATIALYGDAPNTREFCKFVADAKVTILGVVPSLVKAWKQTGAMDGLDWRGIRLFSSTGECSNEEDMLYLMAKAGYKPVIEYCGGTEIGGGYLTGTVVQPAAPATFSTPAMGLDFVILDETDQVADEGELFLVPPSIGLSVKLLNKDHHEVYYEGVPQIPGHDLLRRHGDQVQHIGKGYFRALGRADDTMNLGGIKVSSAEIERVLQSLPGIDETAAVAVPPPTGGPSLLIVFAVLEEGSSSPQILRQAMQQEIRTRLNPLFKIEAVRILSTLPRTASGKVMRRVLRKQYLETLNHT